MLAKELLFSKLILDNGPNAFACEAISNSEANSCFRYGIKDKEYGRVHFGIRSPKACQDICQNEDDCASWTLNIENFVCLSHSITVGKIRQSSNHISGPKYCESSASQHSTYQSNITMCKFNKNHNSCKQILY